MSELNETAKTTIKLPDAGTHEACYYEGQEHRFGVKCPCCAHWCAVLLYEPVHVGGYHSWDYGADCNEPYSCFVVNCRRCGKAFHYTMYFPQ